MDGSTEATDVMWEASKENVQPIRSGRNVSLLKAALQPSEKDIKELKLQRQKLEEDILAGETSTDPLDAWDRYLNWTQQHFPLGETNKTYEQLLEKYIKKFHGSERYKNDPRYVRAWLTMAQIQREPCYAFMNSEGIGTKCATMYVAWAEDFEKYGKYKNADQVYSLAETNNAQPAEYLAKMKNAFQMRVARASAKQVEQVLMEDCSEPATTLGDQRMALGDLSGRGAKKQVGTLRTGQALSTGPVAFKQPVQAPPKPQQNGKLRIYQDDDQTNDPGLPVGKWSNIPDAKKACKENFPQDPKAWKGKKVVQKARSTTLSSGIASRSTQQQQPSFAIYQETTPDTSGNGSAICPPSSRKVCPNVERILTDRKASSFAESDFHKQIRESWGDKDTNIKPMYPVSKIYSVMGEFQPEEVMAAHWRKRKREQEEKQRIERELEARRLQEEEFRQEKIEMKMKIQRREEQLQHLIHMIKDERSEITGTNNVQSMTSSPDVDMTVKLQNVCSKLRQIKQQEPLKIKRESGERDLKSSEFHSASYGRPEKSEFHDFKEEVAIFSRENLHMEDAVKEVPLPSIVESENLSLRRNESVGSVNSSLNHSRLAQPSPTVNTKAAMSTVDDMFQMPLPSQMATPATSIMTSYGPPSDDEGQISLLPVTQPGAAPRTNFAIFCDDDGDEGSISLAPVNLAPPPASFPIFQDGANLDLSDNSENIPTPDYVSPPKRKDLAGILQPAVGFELADPDADSQEEEDEEGDQDVEFLAGVQPIVEAESTFLDDLTIARQAVSGTPGAFYRPAFDESVQFNFASGDKISAESTTYWQGDVIRNPLRRDEVAMETEHAQQPHLAGGDRTAFANAEPEPKKLSPILEASDEYDKTRSRLASSESHASVAMTTAGAGGLTLMNAPKSFLHPPTVHRKKTQAVLGDLSAVKYAPEDSHQSEHSRFPESSIMEEQTWTPPPSAGKFNIFAPNESMRCESLVEFQASPSPSMLLPQTSLVQIEPECGLGRFANDEHEMEALCQDLHSTSIAMEEIPEDKTELRLDAPPNLTLPPSVSSSPAPSSGKLLIVDDPWDPQVVQGQLAKVRHQNVTREQGKTPVARKGCNLRLGCETFFLMEMVGKGGFANVYKARTEQGTVVAIKIQNQKPPLAWETHILGETRRRLAEQGQSSFLGMFLEERATVIFDEAFFIVSEYLSNGTLLDWVSSHAVAASLSRIDVASMSIRIMNLVHALHSVGVIHGDIKPDNFLVVNEHRLSSQIKQSVDLKLIDFGRAIDMSAFPSSTAFMKSCGTSGFVCTQMQEKLPWNYHIDLYGIAGTIHVMLFNSYMKTMRGKKGEWQITLRLPRTSRALWEAVFSVLLNVDTPSDNTCLTPRESPLPSLVKNIEEHIANAR